MVGNLAEDIFHHDHGPVDDNAEIDGADRQQVGGLPPHYRDHHSQEQRHRYSRRDDQRAAQIAEKHPLDQEDQGDAEQQIVQHRLHRDRDEVAAIIERHDLDTGRQRSVRIDPLDRYAHALDHLHGAFELLHQHDAGDDVGLVVTAGETEPGCEADLDFGDI